MTQPAHTSLLLTAQHTALLVEDSAIAPALVQQRGYRSLPQPEDLIDRGFSKAQAKAAPALGIPLWDVHGQRHGWQIRPDSPRQMHDGKVFKYELPKGDRLILDVHPSVQPRIGDPHEPLWLTEGVRKGDSLASQELCSIALVGGVWGFRGTNAHGGKVILPDWESVALNGREVIVVFDSDLYLKPAVEAALKALYRLLRDRAARPRLVQWPEDYRQQKWGVDDFFAQGHTLEELRAMLPPLGPLPQSPARRRNGDRPGPPPGTSASPTPALPTILITPDVGPMVDEATEALLHLPQAPRIYQRARQLCVIARHGTPPKWLRRQADTPLIQTASPAHLWELLTHAADWKKWHERKHEWQPDLPPRWVVDVLQGRTAWPFPMLEGLICCPTLRPDGSILAQPGYDESTGLYLDCGGTTFPSLPTAPTLDNARSALGRLAEVFQDFLFAVRAPSAGDHQPLLQRHPGGAPHPRGPRRDCRQRAPLWGDRDRPRCGKGLLVDVLCTIATGRSAPKMGQTLDDNEELKRLLALALEGASVCCVDNVTHPLGNQYLDMALTAQAITGRILGQTQTAEAPWNAVLFATGNNLSYRGDMTRRVVPIALDPQMEKPEERSGFAHPDLEAWVQQERPRLVICALTILRAYCVAGRPSQGLTPYGSFQPWSDLVRNAVVWLGEADPCEGRQDLAAQTDEAYEQLATLLTAWEACYAGQVAGTPKDMTINQVKQDIALYTAGKGTAEKDAVPTSWDDLREALIPFDRRYDGKSLDTNRVGNALRTIEGRVIDGKRLRRHGEYRHNALWRIEKV